ncbi:NnrS family protein [Ferrimonas aestuarii]|uniref:NnrS family protein n=1 Tax=Ferrimonas aestuarii TaxID=2569539 RepID=A0A4U1BN18_9GAMM|nr:NnrS family protein [Ferrimonas aestuarii]TKB54327.1 NnrS family protein [Ferrimonas aestuarii]
MLNIHEPNNVDNSVPLWRLGFRPFFLGGAIVATLWIPLWLWAWYSPQTLPLFSSEFWSPVVPLWWHPHEMLFGFGMAIVAGFLLTASQTWTNQPGLKGPALAILVGCWAIARILLLVPLALPLWLPALFDSAFLLLTALKLMTMVVKVKQWRNVALPLLLLFALGLNLLSYWALSERNLVLSFTIWQGMLMWMALLMSFMGGRVIPFFTAARLKLDKKPAWPWLDWSIFVVLALLAIQVLTEWLPSQLELGLLLYGGAAQLLRQSRWHAEKCAKEPLLWSLHLAYLMIPLALLGMALYHGDPLASRQFLHLLAVGAMGGMILAMIARVSLGHTGRNLYQGPNMAPAFISIFAAALIRGVLPTLAPEWTQLWHWLSGSLWSIAFGLFLFYYLPFLTSARVDGRPG